MISSIFDPLGFIVPVMLSSKLLLQELCREGFSWDDPISESHRARWKCWVDSLPQIEKLQIKRCFKPKGFQRPVCVQLHHFSDASQQAYGACSYLRLVNENGFVHCSFLIGKSRLVPLKTVSIPRLELTAAVLAVKLDSMLRKELKVEITATTFWCDSTAVLQILANSTKRFPTFVANRIATIERMVSLNSSWRHVPTQLNPADLASRGLTAENLVNDQNRLQAPDYLWNPEDCWPHKLDMTTFLSTSVGTSFRFFTNGFYVTHSDRKLQHGSSLESSLFFFLSFEGSQLAHSLQILSFI